MGHYGGIYNRLKTGVGEDTILASGSGTLVMV